MEIMAHSMAVQKYRHNSHKALPKAVVGGPAGQAMAGLVLSLTK